VPSKDIDVTALMSTPELKHNTRYKLSAPTRSKSKREYILEGMDHIKKSFEIKNEEVVPTIINGVEIRPAKMIDKLAMQSWVDNLIKHWFGATRDGLLITWTLDDGYRYNYDIYEHRLTRIKIS
jgi:hypothetical protein